MMKILFICKHNRFGSKVAEALFKKYNENKNIEVKSRGIIKDVDVAESVVEIMKKKEIEIDKKSRPVSRKEIINSDLIVIVADNVPESIFENKDVEKWDIRDASSSDLEDTGFVVDKIEEKIKNLIKELKD